jgi:hypothetical protein
VRIRRAICNTSARGNFPDGAIADRESCARLNKADEEPRAHRNVGARVRSWGISGNSVVADAEESAIDRSIVFSWSLP